jgi:hypothetical protein
MDALELRDASKSSVSKKKAGAQGNRHKASARAAEALANSQ